MTFYFEYLSEFGFIFKNDLGLKSGDKEGSFEKNLLQSVPLTN
jgi:hypothetical protein